MGVTSMTDMIEGQPPVNCEKTRCIP